MRTLVAARGIAVQRFLRRVPLALALVSVAVGGPLQAQKELKGKLAEQVARAEALLDEENPSAALEILDQVLRKEDGVGRPYLLRSTARFMLGDLEAGSEDLDRALELDPSLRQGWLNLGALRLSQERWEDALTAWQRAEKLDPEASDNDLNIGTALLLLGRLAEAKDRFSSYLEGRGGDAEDLYLVAKNYALAGYQAPALQHLERAIAAEERMRLRARTDPAFSGLADSEAFGRLLSEKRYQPPPGAYVADRTFRQGYDPQGGQLLGAVLEALRSSGIPFEPRVEVTERWAVIWSKARIEVDSIEGDSGGNPSQGKVTLTAPPDAFTPAEWKAMTERLFQSIEQQILSNITLPRDRKPK